MENGSLARMLKAAEEIGSWYCARGDRTGGYTLRFTLSSGAQFEMAPESLAADWIRDGFITAFDGPLILTSAIVAVEVLEC